MESERWQKIERLYHLALEQEKNRRAAFVEQACGGDQSLQRELELLLAQDSTEDFLERPALEVAARDLASGGKTALPAFIGRYRIVRLLGEGGMGTVYEAEQEGPRRIVALKIIRPGLATPERLRRFKHESQALGRLQHPGIAQIYEANTADTGFGPQPYFAMELIRGQSLEKYGDAHQLNTRQRLALMVKVCESVHHAHQRGLIHRDLKPGNILVDDTGQPKILDFGVARLAEIDAQVTLQTEVGELVGTLAYMSPEQVQGDPLEVDIRSDIYSLGVILYELLAGRLPYDVNRLKLYEAIQTIREEDPVSLGSIRGEYSGDIETIVGKALEKVKARRYASAADLAADIQRYLNDEPITARAPTAGYHLRKFTRRHRALVAGVAAVFVVLIAGVAASTWEAIRANRAGQLALAERDRATAAERETRQERDRALQAEHTATIERNRAVAAEAGALQDRNHALLEKRRADDESASARAVNNFLQQDLLAQASAHRQARRDSPPDPDLKVRTALDRAAAGIEGKFGKQPLVEASIRQTIGRAYLDLGLYSPVEKQFERSFELKRRILGPDHPETLRSMDDLAVLYLHNGKKAQARPLLIKGLEIEPRVLGENHRITAATMSHLASLYRSEGRYKEAEALYAKAVEIERRVLGPEDPDTLMSLNNMGLVYLSEGKFDQAELIFGTLLYTHRQLHGDEHPLTLLSMDNLASAYQHEGKYSESEPLESAALEIERRVLGDSHPKTLVTMCSLARTYRGEGKYQEGERLQSRALEIELRVLGAEHPDTLACMNNLGALYRAEGRYADAETVLNKALETKRRVMGAEHPDTLTGMHELGSLYRSQGRYAEAETILSRVLEAEHRVLGPAHPYTTAVMATLGELRLQLAQYAAAETVVREALANWEKTRPDAWQQYYVQALLGASLAGQRRYVEAEPLLVAGNQGLLRRESTVPGENRHVLADAGEWVVRMYENWGKAGMASAWRDKVRMK